MRLLCGDAHLNSHLPFVGTLVSLLTSFILRSKVSRDWEPEWGEHTALKASLPKERSWSLELRNQRVATPRVKGANILKVFWCWWWGELPDVEGGSKRSGTFAF